MLTGLTRLGIAVAVGAVLAGGPVAAAELPPEEARARVTLHLDHAGELLRHFEAVLEGPCPDLETAAEWRAHLDAEVDRMTLLVARLAEAWEEAKRTGDDDVRRQAKAPRRLAERAPELVNTYRVCAGELVEEIEFLALWRRIERDVPSRRAEIALPR